MLESNDDYPIVADRLTRGFILQPTYRIESGGPAVWLYGRADSGESFLIRDTRSVPRFFVRRSDASRARELGARIPDGASALSTLDREPAVVHGDVRIAGAPDEAASQAQGLLSRCQGLRQ